MKTNMTAALWITCFHGDCVDMAMCMWRGPCMMKLYTARRLCDIWYVAVRWLMDETCLEIVNAHFVWKSTRGRSIMYLLMLYGITFLVSIPGIMWLSLFQERLVYGMSSYLRSIIQYSILIRPFTRSRSLICFAANYKLWLPHAWESSDDDYVMTIWHLYTR